jgi:signal transduction histidine kinase
VTDAESPGALVDAELARLLEALCHDLRGPVRAADGFSGALLRAAGAAADQEARDHLQRIRAAAAQMGVQLEALSRLSRAASAELHPAPVDLTALAREVADGLRRADPERQVEVAVAAGLEVIGDPHLLRILLQVLLHNAWRHTGRGRIQVASGDRAILVRDDGEGFDPARARHLFEPFGSVHPHPGGQPPAAMGLAIARRIVHRHGGRIWAEGAPGQGATFWFTLGRHTA